MEKIKINWDKILNYSYYIALVVLIIWLIIFRTEIWLHKATFFHDEAALLINIKEHSFLDLFKTLDNIQCCPAFFLIFNKVIYNIYGLNEVALCFLPYIAGIFSIILIPFISNKLFNSKVFSFLFLILFTYHPDATIASQTFKQYSTDILSTFLMISFFLYLKDKIKSNKHFLYTGLFFGLMGYFSFTSEFVIFPIFIYFIFHLIKEKNIKSIVLLSFPYLILLGVEYFLLKGTYNSGIMEWFNFPPIYNSIKDFYTTISYLVSHIGNQSLIFCLFILGIILLLTKDGLLAYITITPFCLNIFTQFLGIYPCPNIQNNRIILYLMPLLMIIALKSFEIIYLFLKSKKLVNIVNCLILILSISILCFIFRVHFLQHKIYIEDKYYYFILTNVKEYIKHLETHKVNQTDNIIVDKMGHRSFNLYSNNKYEKNAIYLADDIVPLDYISKDERIWFYNTKYICTSDEWINGIKSWIRENCEIIIWKKDNMGELYYVKKVK